MTHTYLTPPEIARRLRVSVDRVRGWLARGELRGCNVGDGPRRPRWRVAEYDLQAFLAGRECPASSPRRPRRRRIAHQPPSYIV